jgi:hypothetical protein
MDADPCYVTTPLGMPRLCPLPSDSPRTLSFALLVARAAPPPPTVLRSHQAATCLSPSLLMPTRMANKIVNATIAIDAPIVPRCLLPS